MFYDVSQIRNSDPTTDVFYTINYLSYHRTRKWYYSFISFTRQEKYYYREVRRWKAIKFNKILDASTEKI